MDLKYQIFDITSRDTDPSKISLVSEITGTPPNSCGPGCGGKFMLRAHKGWWSQETGYFYAASGEPGFRNVVIQIFDLKNPKAPKLVGRAWLPGLKDGEPGYEGQYSHHPIVDEENKRLYVGYRNAGGQAASFDISDPANPKLVWEIDMNPPHRGPHTVSPIVYDRVPNFGKSALPRTYAYIVDEAAAPADMKPCTNGVRPEPTCSISPTRRSRFRYRCGRCRSATSATKAAASVRINPRRRSTARSIDSRQDCLARLLQRRHSRGRFKSIRISIKELGYYIPKTNKNSYPIEEGPADSDPDQRRRYRSPRPGLRVGSRGHGIVRPGVHRKEGSVDVRNLTVES